ncbi:MAG: (deoxy)nucleoside triphosphate pyrophosphohydrolase [Erythrobacter sp.]
MISDWIPVVAAALRDKSGLWLMHRRPIEKHHGGLWEFPGGKLEPRESPVSALIRELQEELGIVVARQDCEPCGFAQEPETSGKAPIVILLYTIEHWQGEPAALEGGEVGWFEPAQVDRLKKPPLDIALARQLFGKG